jgi:CheY-like chemotaxis protein
MADALRGVVVVAVEDDPDGLALLQLVMEHDGALVVPASDASSALDTLRRVRPTILVTDLSMPSHDGIWLVTEARRSGLLTDVPAVLLTAFTMTPQEVREAGFDAYLQKPVDPAALRGTVLALCHHAA